MHWVRDELEGWPDIVLIIIILILESQKYCSPQDGLATWKFFSQQDGCLSPTDFISLPATIDKCNEMLTSPPVADSFSNANSPGSTESSHSDSDSTEEPGVTVVTNPEDDAEPFTLEPITIAGHTWCHIKNVQYHVWVKNGDAKINIYDDKKHIGCLYPNILMDGVEPVIRKGLSATKEKLSDLVKAYMSSSDILVNFNWKKIQMGLRVATQLTAKTHYETWYYQSFHGVKHRLEDEEYQPPMGVSTPSEPLVGSGHCKPSPPPSKTPIKL
ncbi:hypothetical protein PAXRUDRAFT_36815 [Paxillus rubicundulus Ve08.2h10]|uniref:Uncharacterized protein n=1 Tax=Paxillus rubicundulus Ve08.2h10 TaxID=930991 RepID=A0A0D0CPL7_9AGAM|nr:hypothetical protein PAXRUDRAFT_36815 [Paxillus rubicundulus Ve08.2h10]